MDRADFGRPEGTTLDLSPYSDATLGRACHQMHMLTSLALSVLAIVSFPGLVPAQDRSAAASETALEAPAAEPVEEATAVAPAPPAEVSALFSRPIEHFTMDNGLEVFLQPDERSSQAAVCTSYQVGSRDDPAGYLGLAHLLEHMAFRGSQNVPDGYLTLLDDAGASSYNGYTTNDRTNYYAVVPPSRVEVPLWIEADRLAYLLTGASEEFLRDEQQIVVHEWRERGGDGTGARIRRALWEEFYPEGHPYRTPPDDPDDVRAISLSDIQWHFQRYYQPNNARLAVVGRFDGPAMRERIEQWFGRIRGQRSAPPRRRGADPVELAGETVVHMEGSVGRARIIMAWPSPAFLAPGDAELDIVASVLDGGVDKRLEQALVGTEIANRVSARQSSDDLGSSFVIDVSGNIDKTAAEMLPIIERELERLRTELIDARDVASAVARWQTAWLAGQDSIGSRACNLASIRPPDGESYYDLSYQHRRYAGITPDAVRETARRYLPSDRRVVVIMENDDDAGDLEVVSIERPTSGAQ